MDAYIYVAIGTAIGGLLNAGVNALLKLRSQKFNQNVQSQDEAFKRLLQLTERLNNEIEERKEQYQKLEEKYDKLQERYLELKIGKIK